MTRSGLDFFKKRKIYKFFQYFFLNIFNYKLKYLHVYLLNKLRIIYT